MGHVAKVLWRVLWPTGKRTELIESILVDCTVNFASLTPYPTNFAWTGIFTFTFTIQIAPFKLEDSKAKGV